MIVPGEKIGDFLITTSVEGNFTYPFDITCAEAGDGNSYDCEVLVGTAINVSTGIFDDSGSGNLDEIWSKSNYQMFINDRLVDMQAFDVIEYDHPNLGVIRFADVIIIAHKPGVITVRDSGLRDDGQVFASTSTYTFKTP